MGDSDDPGAAVGLSRLTQVHLSDGSCAQVPQDDLHAFSAVWQSLRETVEGGHPPHGNFWVAELGRSAEDGALATPGAFELWLEMGRVWQRLQPGWGAPDRWRAAREEVRRHEGLRRGLCHPDLPRAVRLGQALGPTEAWRTGVRVTLRALCTTRTHVLGVPARARDPAMPPEVRACWLRVLAEGDGLLDDDFPGGGAQRFQDHFGVLCNLPTEVEALRAEWSALSRCLQHADARRRMAHWPEHAKDAAFVVAAAQAAAGAPELRAAQALLDPERALMLALSGGFDELALGMVDDVIGRMAKALHAHEYDAWLGVAAEGGCLRAFAYLCDGLVEGRWAAAGGAHGLAHVQDRAFVQAARNGCRALVSRIISEVRRTGAPRGALHAPVVLQAVECAARGGHADVVDVIQARVQASGLQRDGGWVTAGMLDGMLRAGRPTLEMVRLGLRLVPRWRPRLADVLARVDAQPERAAIARALLADDQRPPGVCWTAVRRAARTEEADLVRAVLDRLTAPGAAAQEGAAATASAPAGLLPARKRRRASTPTSSSAVAAGGWGDGDDRDDDDDGTDVYSTTSDEDSFG